MSTAITKPMSKYEQALAKGKKAEIALEGKKERAKAEKMDLEEKAIVFVTSGALGFLKARYAAKREEMPTFMNIPPKLLYAAVAFGVQQYAPKGLSKRVASGTVDTLIGAYAEEMGEERGSKFGHFAKELAKEAFAVCQDLADQGKTEAEVATVVTGLINQLRAASAVGGGGSAGRTAPAAH